MEENNSFIHYQPGHNIYDLDYCDERDPYVKPFFNVDNGEQFYEAGCYKNDICD